MYCAEEEYNAECYYKEEDYKAGDPHQRLPSQYPSSLVFLLKGTNSRLHIVFLGNSQAVCLLLLIKGLLHNSDQSHKESILNDSSSLHHVLEVLLLWRTNSLIHSSTLAFIQEVLLPWHTNNLLISGCLHTPNHTQEVPQYTNMLCYGASSSNSHVDSLLLIMHSIVMGTMSLRQHPKFAMSIFVRSLIMAHMMNMSTTKTNSMLGLSLLHHHKYKDL